MRAFRATLENQAVLNTRDGLAGAALMLTLGSTECYICQGRDCAS